MLVEWVLAIAIPLRLDLYLPVPADNPLTLEKTELGRRLFFDRRLSADGSMSGDVYEGRRRALEPLANR